MTELWKELYSLNKIPGIHNGIMLSKDFSHSFHYKVVRFCYQEFSIWVHSFSMNVDQFMTFYVMAVIGDETIWLCKHLSI